MTSPALLRFQSPDETLDTFLDGTLQILQGKRGYRFSLDAILLSQFVRILRDEKVIDLGTGNGILPLLLSKTTKAQSFVGVEIQKELAECARKNVTLNHLEDRITVLNRDYRDLKEAFPPCSFDIVLSNPPYRIFRTGRLNSSGEKAIARHEIRGTLDDLIATASYLLRQKGRCFLIFPASRAVDLLAFLRKRGLEPKRLQLVYPFMGADAKFVLAESIKSSGAELRILAPLILR